VTGEGQGGQGADDQQAGAPGTKIDYQVFHHGLLSRSSVDRSIDLYRGATKKQPK
jgi:hypothetical protein